MRSTRGSRVRITRTFRDGSTQDWWALEIVAGPYGSDKTERAVVATTDPQTLPDLTTWYLVTNLPAPTTCPVTAQQLAPANLEEVIRLYGLRMWVEQSYKQVKHAASVVTVSSEKRPGHPARLPTGLLRLLVLLVSCLSPLLQHDGRCERSI